MASFTIERFGGEVPKLGARLLPDNMAQSAIDCNLFSGYAKPWKVPATVATPAKPGTQRTIYRWGQDQATDSRYWFTWTTDVDVVRGPIAGDTSERTYWTGDGAPKVTDSSIAVAGGGTQYPNGSYTLGIPAPADQPLLTVNDIILPVQSMTRSGNTVTVGCTNHGFKDKSTVSIAGADQAGYDATWAITLIDADSFSFQVTDTTLVTPATGAITAQLAGNKVTRAYVDTFVSTWGEEGPPSLANTVDWQPGRSVTLSSLSPVPAGAYNIQTRRIYRTETGTSGDTAYYFVAELPVATATWTDTVDDTDLGEALPSLDWVAPPTDLQGLIELPGGVMAGFSGNDLCFSEPYHPHAWPIKYRLTMAWPIVAIGAFDSSVVVATTGQPYLATGTSPATMQETKLDGRHACVSKRSLVDLGFGVVYATSKGLVLIGEGGLKVVSEPFFTRDEWALLNPASISAWRWQDAYVGFYDTGTVQGGFIFDPNSPGKEFTRLSTYATAGYNDQKSGELYLMTGANIQKWDAGPASGAFTWRSKKFVESKPVNMGVAQIHAAAFPVTFKLYADGVLKLTKTVNNSSVFKLPAGYKATEWEVELSGSNAVEKVFVAETTEEMKQI